MSACVGVQATEYAANRNKRLQWHFSLVSALSLWLFLSISLSLAHLLSLSCFRSFSFSLIRNLDGGYDFFQHLQQHFSRSNQKQNCQKELFIKYAGCLYSIRNVVPHARYRCPQYFYHWRFVRLITCRMLHLPTGNQCARID